MPRKRAEEAVRLSEEHHRRCVKEIRELNPGRLYFVRLTPVSKGVEGAFSVTKG